MKRIQFAFAAAFLVCAGLVRAEQSQHYGRDSVYAVPGTSTRPSTAVITPINRFGRDSLYVTQQPNMPSTPVSADAKGLQQFGRDSTYAGGSPNGTTAPNAATAVRATGQRQGG